MWLYLLACIPLIIAWKLASFARYYRKEAELFRTIPIHPDNHWLLGLLHKVRSIDDFLKLFQEYVDRTKPTSFHFWTLFLHPNLVIVHPKTMKAVLNALWVPKQRGAGGLYQLLEPWIGEGLAISEGTKWERNRRLLTPAFHFDILKPYVAVYHDVTDVFLDKLANLSKGGRRFDIIPHFAKATLDTVLRCALSHKDRKVQEGDHHPYVEATHKLGYLLFQRMTNPFLFPDFIYYSTTGGKEFKKACEFVHQFADGIIESRSKSLKSDPSQLEKRHLDFLDILLTSTDDTGTGLSRKEIRDEVDTFLLAGHETTATSMSWALYFLAKYPDMQQKVRQDVEGVLNGGSKLLASDIKKLGYTACFIKEALRMYNPSLIIGRKLDKPMEIDGVLFPAGTDIHLFIHLLHHNPAVWENHMEFRPERFMPETFENKDPFAFLPFSAGQRNCIGQNLAMQEMKVMISRIVTRFEVILDDDRVAVPCPGQFMRPKDGLYLKFKPL